MQKWKQALQISGRFLSPPEGVLGYISHDLKVLRGKWVRITVEEIVDDRDCCERWRENALCGVSYITDFGSNSVNFRPTFCPECGHKL